MKNTIVLLAFLSLAACSSSDSTPAANQDGGTVLTELSTAVTGAMAAGVPNVGAAAFRFNPRAAGDWIVDVLHLARLGDGSSTNISPADYVTDLFNPSYVVDDFGPTPFGRFTQELEILEIIAEQVPFSNGAPAVGTHSITTTVGDDQQEVTFSFVVAASTNANFDVVFSIDEDFLQYYGAMRNTAAEINYIGLEAEEADRGGMSILFWDRTTGKLRYDFVAKQATGPTIELHRMFVEETGGMTHVAHVYKVAGNEHKVVVAAPAGSSSTEFSVSFEKEDTNAGDDIAAQTYCVNASDGEADTNAACASAALAAGDVSTLITQIDGFANAAAMRAAVFGADFANRDAVLPNYDTGDLAEFLTSLPIQ